MKKFMTIILNRRSLAVTAILALVILTAFSYKVKQVFVRLSDLESAVEDVSNTASDHASEIDDLRSDVDNLQRER